MSNTTTREASVGNTVAEPSLIIPIEKQKTQKNVKKTKIKKPKKKKSDELHRWDHSCNLPDTPFSKVANSIPTEARILDMWKSENLYKTIAEMNPDGTKFVLHDGPPFANGNIHQGHAFNKIMKDIMCKVKRMQGHNVSFIPGWDCHGLPIELKLKATDDQMGRTQLIKSCREYAAFWIQQQKEQFMKLGVLADWNNPYITMNPNYEADVLDLFSRFVEKDLISRKEKTTPWCPSCETVLAIAEIQYQTVHVDSYFVLFPIHPDSISPSLMDVMSASSISEISFLVWTTALWSVPMNRALLIRPNIEYSIAILDDGRCFIASSHSIGDLIRLQPFSSLRVVHKLSSADLIHLRAINPTSHDTSSDVPIIEDDVVTISEGTAILHLAPGCGHKDYLIGIQRNLPIYSPIDSHGKYGNDIVPKELAGMSMEEGEAWIVSQNSQRIFKRELPWEHLEPHCWRCDSKLVFRSTPQWFFNIRNFSENSRENSEKIQFLPKQSKSVFLNVLKSRDDWCLSRQRIWGVPIPAVTCQNCHVPFLIPEMIRKVASKIRNEGIEFWARMNSIDDLKREQILPDEFSCKSCLNFSTFNLERDILDVWFVSGLSKSIVLPDFQVDIFFEGKDQHRGWFSSSLLCNTALGKSVPTKTFMTHGFCTNSNGQKLSKSSTPTSTSTSTPTLEPSPVPDSTFTPISTPDSTSTSKLKFKSKISTTLLNVNAAMEYRSADVLRLWAATSSWNSEISHSDFVMATVRHDYMKIRKTFRNLLAHLYDFDRVNDLLPISQMLQLDQFTLQNLFNLNVKVVKCFNLNEISMATKLITTYLKDDLRCFFLDSAKFRLYHSRPDSYERRSAQNAVWRILETMLHLLAPILSFLAEEIWECLGTGSIHTHQFVTPSNVFLDTCQSDVRKSAEKFKLISTLEKMRQFLGREASRKDVGHLGNLFRAKVTIAISMRSECHDVMKQLLDEVASADEFLIEYFTVSECHIVWDDEMTEPWKMEVEAMDGVECQRCWRFRKEDEMRDGICPRCQSVVFQDK